jgi:protein phosphatase
VLDVGEVTGRRVIETGYLRRIDVREENAAAALEVMSRFAIDPRWLLYLPPTMSPVATSVRPDLLEHSDQAFDAYRAEGVSEVVCEEKQHMGSRAVALVFRDLDAAGRGSARPAAPSARCGPAPGGRSSTSPAPPSPLTGSAPPPTGAGLFDELGTSWRLLDAELLPWAAKAEQLLRDQYAAVGAAARTVLPAAVAALERAAAGGLDVSGLLARTRSRAANANAYRRYCWETDGLDGTRLAPFQLLASQGAAHHAKPHASHLDVADRLSRPTRACSGARAWWSSRPRT